MYAVYGLKEDMTVERFIGYVPAKYFQAFRQPSFWKVISINLPDGHRVAGRLCGRAFFTRISGMQASKTDLAHYMADAPCAKILDMPLPE